jgi:hypothetical protein
MRIEEKAGLKKAQTVVEQTRAKLRPAKQMNVSQPKAERKLK